MSQTEKKDTILSFTEPTDYSDCTITDIKRGKGGRAIYTYATLRNAKGEVLIHATLDYIVSALEDRLPGKIEPIINPCKEIEL